MLQRRPGERVIIDGQEAGAYEALVTFNDEKSAVFRPDFMEHLGFELNPAETDIEDEDVIASRVLLIEDEDEYEDDYDLGEGSACLIQCLHLILLVLTVR